MSDEITVKIKFQVQTKYGVFQDAISGIPLSDFNAMSESDIEALKKSRVDDYVSKIDAVSVAESEKVTEE